MTPRAPRRKILCIFGTRPEAVKLAPVVRALRGSPSFSVQVCVTAQHRRMLDQVLEAFAIRPDFDLDLMRPAQSLSGLTAAVLRALDPVLARVRPDWALVQGDTTTTLTAALAAFYHKVPVAHVEAGLRTGDLGRPWPEELNRRLVGTIASLHFAPTPGARDALRREGVPAGRIFVTGNTVVDALGLATARLAASPSLRERMDRRLGFLDPGRRLILVTGHRQENFGAGFAGVCDALARIARRPDVQVVYPVHLNPKVRDDVRRRLLGTPNLTLIDPLDYLSFVHLMTRATLILTDSGGIQEEAPALGKPVLVLRALTERPEAVRAGCARLVGVDPRRIVRETERLLDEPARLRAMARRRLPFGDGRAAQRIVSILARA
ncbi:MAG: UDP-N-acetylglucosamine 2-epimerase [Elusimicrobia bacterium GWA2_69_24]|nr:MAG: UDP-N-acetylglucosamine 2-epimerase [Elusimicrobia bacterium GWA2_69_24]